MTNILILLSLDVLLTKNNDQKLSTKVMVTPLAPLNRGVPLTIETWFELKWNKSSIAF